MNSLEQLDPNYVISFKYSKKNLAQLLAEFSVRGLVAVTRPGPDATTLYAFTRVDTSDAVNDDIYTLSHVFDFIIAVTPLYDHHVSKQLNGLLRRMSSWKSALTLPTERELLALARLTGNPEQSLYFAYFKNYIHWLFPLACFGFFFRVVVSRFVPWEFNRLYTAGLLLWAIAFTSMWVYKKKQYFISVFATIHPSTIFHDRKENSTYSSHVDVILKKCCFIPITVLFIALLVLFQLFCFFIEIYITQLYSGPFVMILSLIPSVLMSLFTLILTAVYNSVFVDRFIKWENGPNPSKSKMEKNIIVAFFSNYLPLLITLFLYLPFGYKVTPTFKQTITEKSAYYRVPTTNNDFSINTKRHQSQIFYFTVTNQVLSIVLENGVPYLLDQLKNYRKKRNNSNNEYLFLEEKMKTSYPRELDIWKKVYFYHNGDWGEFDIDENVKKLTIQFGFICLFSVIWPLSPLIYMLCDYLIFKLDLWRAIKKCTPISLPNDTERRYDENELDVDDSTTDSWNIILESILLVSAVIAPTLTYMYSNCRLPNIGFHNALEKRDHWYTYFPFQHNWSSIIFFALFMEHFSAILYFVVAKLIVVAEEKKKRGYIPVVKSELPEKTDLLPVSIETNEYMEKLKKEMQDKGVFANGKKNQDASSEKVKDIFKFTEDGQNKKVEENEEENSGDEFIPTSEKPHSTPKFSKIIKSPKIINPTASNNDLFPGFEVTDTPENLPSQVTNPTIVSPNKQKSKKFNLRNGLKKVIPLRNSVKNEATAVVDLGKHPRESLEHGVNNIGDFGKNTQKTLHTGANAIEDFGRHPGKSLHHEADNVGKIGKNTRKTVQHEFNNVEDIGKSTRETLHTGANAIEDFGRHPGKSLHHEADNVGKIGKSTRKTVQHEFNNVEDIGKSTRETLHTGANAIEDFGRHPGKSLHHQADNVGKIGKNTHKTVEHEFNNVEDIGKSTRETLHNEVYIVEDFSKHPGKSIEHGIDNAEEFGKNARKTMKHDVDHMEDFARSPSKSLHRSAIVVEDFGKHPVKSLEHGANDVQDFGRSHVENVVDPLLGTGKSGKVSRKSSRKSKHQHHLDNSTSLAASAAATAINTDKTEIERKSRKNSRTENEFIEPLQGIENIRKSMSLRRKSIVSDLSNHHDVNDYISNDSIETEHNGTFLNKLKKKLSH